MAGSAVHKLKEVAAKATEAPETAISWSWRYVVPGGVVVVIVLAVIIFEVAYAGKAYPGVTADGVAVGGLNRGQATAAIKAGTASYIKDSLPLHYGSTKVNIPLASLGLNYNSVQSAEAALKVGRNGSWWSRLTAQIGSLAGRSANVATFTYDDAALANYVGSAVDALDTTVINASLGVNGTQVSVAPATAGQRLDLGMLTQQIDDRLATASTAPVTATTYSLEPDVETANLKAVTSQASTYLTSPLTLTYAGQTTTVPLTTIASWLTVSSQAARSDGLPAYETLPSSVSVGLNKAAVTAYVASLAAKVDTSPVNATITMTNGQPTAASMGQNGQSLDQASAVTAISNTLSKPSSSHTLALTVNTVKPAVNNDNLASLGITSLLSEGETWFAGSGYDRDTNIRLGAARFNNVLIAPGQTLSIGQQLGEVDASTGYKPGYVILGNSEELQYGGGLCQVATTAYRAALLAGLPIVERSPHSYAVSYYVAPYSAPGVDATIYYPETDLKFTNDTGHYILIQTIMSGETLKFDFYGTKTKYAKIRGPYFIYGSNDATKASKTVFYRDIYNLAGQVTHTDTVYSSYEPSTDFPIEAD